MTDMKLSVGALGLIFEDDLKVELEVKFKFNMKLSLNLGFSFFFFLTVSNFFFLCRYLFQHMSSS